MRRPSPRSACSPCCFRWPERPTWPTCCRWSTACCSRVRPPMSRRRASARAACQPTCSIPRRDALTMALVPAAIESGTPLFGVCRGLQEMNVALGGSLYQQLHSEPGLMDHREPEDADLAVQFATRHEVRLAPGSAFAQWAGGTAAHGELAARAGHQAAGRAAGGRKRWRPTGWSRACASADARRSLSACNGIPSGGTRAIPSTRGPSRPSRRPAPSTAGGATWPDCSVGLGHVVLNAEGAEMTQRTQRERTAG